MRRWTGVLAAGTALAVTWPAGSRAMAAVKWDYTANPVSVTENLASPAPLVGLEVKRAFDGYGAQGTRPAAVASWYQGKLRTREEPFICEIDYGRPVQVSAFVHCFYVPDGRDMRYTSPAPGAFNRVRISSSDDAVTWTPAVTHTDLPPDCPQVIPVNADRAARYWRIEVEELAPGAEFLCSYEIETYTSGIPVVPAADPMTVDFRGAFEKRVRALKGSVDGSFARGSDGKPFAVKLESGGGAISGRLEVLVDGEAQELTPDGSDRWRAVCQTGAIILQAEDVPAGTLLGLEFRPATGHRLKHQRAELRLTVDDPDLYYMPAQVWSRVPVEFSVNCAMLQTRLAALGKGGMVLSLVPGTDRGTLAFREGKIVNSLLLGPETTPLLLTATKGDWWSAYITAARDVFGFGECRQSVPVSEMQAGISRYLMREDIWEPALGTLRSWPPRDPHYELYGKGFDCFAFYGAPYSIPAYWSRWVMCGDRQALERCRAIVHWLCTSGVRMKEGPAHGAFFNLQRFTNGEAPSPDKKGSTQAGTPVLTSQSTGAALWALLFYRRVSGDDSDELKTAIRDSSEWLKKTQRPDGGWPYGHNVDGTEVEGAPSGGSVWNIWALWRLGKQTGDDDTLARVKKATEWYERTFVREHHYHGYWEDVGPNSREGYDAAVAAVAFAEMGERELTVACAKDAVQWVFTRQVEHREATNSAGLVAEQLGWPPASYCNPMMGLAAQAAWAASGDDVWKGFASIPKATGWWYQPETGAMVWIVDSVQPAPVVGPCFESWWSDWCIAQPGALYLRWLIRDLVRRAAGKAEMDDETLQGELMGESVRLWAPPGGLRPTIPAHGQVNWLGFRSERSAIAAFMNYDGAGEVGCRLQSGDVGRAMCFPLAAHTLVNGRVKSTKWDGGPVKLPSGGMVLLEWQVVQ